MSATTTATAYAIDSVHSNANFAVRHMMISTVRGQFTKVTGEVTWDPNDLSSASITAVIDVNSIDTRDAGRDGHLKGGEFFDAEKFPTITFRSKRFVKEGSSLKVEGDLTIRDTTRQVVLDVIEGPSEETKDPWGNLRVGATAKTRINRKDYGVSWNAALDNGGVMVSEDVEITLDIQLTRK